MFAPSLSRAKGNPMSATAFQRMRREAAAKTNETPDRDGIGSMKKAELVEWLEAHGADTEGKVDELRDRLSAIMFMEA